MAGEGSEPVHDAVPRAGCPRRGALGGHPTAGPPVPPRTSAAHGRLGAASLPDGSLTLFLSALCLGSPHTAFLVSGGAGGRHVLSRGLQTESRHEAAGPPGACSGSTSSLLLDEALGAAGGGGRPLLAWGFR